MRVGGPTYIGVVSLRKASICLADRVGVRGRRYAEDLIEGGERFQCRESLNLYQPGSCVDRFPLRKIMEGPLT